MNPDSTGRQHDAYGLFHLEHPTHRVLLTHLSIRMPGQPPCISMDR
ncbi:MAG: hypothetical protein Q4B13_05885 [Lautropia sp.]|nr:hypothetical protein [Lautropia sp.]